jgi:TetR/AcrR family transcriptional regulator, cholesterol catabolism regulator
MRPMATGRVSNPADLACLLWGCTLARPNKWNDIVQAAAEEFRLSGYDGTTIEAIARRVGILKGSLYNYISSKEDLLFAVLEQPAKELLEHVEQLEGSQDLPASERLQMVFRRQVRAFSENYPAAFVYLQMIGKEAHPEEFQAMDRRYITALEGLIEDGIRQGEFAPSTKVGVAARAVIGMLDWMQHWFVPRSEQEDEQTADELFALAVGGLASGGLVRSRLGNGAVLQAEH